ncbi:hypothetical protein Y1Q_0004724 [Alligator mississippiensis]|uniref:Uncharacterized protein n=1 Tax=Alligator mississippiensis TaxID=8496 RepID=A0A151NFH6_ALLMI|nr:hypothetical protein Y1Q_0004724 [Alligator mississippiensis]
MVSMGTPAAASLMSQKTKSSSMPVTEQEPDTSINRGPSGTQNDLKDLLNIWSEEKIIEQLESRSNKPVYTRRAKEMKAQGHNQDWTQHQSKIKALRCVFNWAKDKNSHSGARRTIAPFYYQLSIILSKEASCL